MLHITDNSPLTNRANQFAVELTGENIPRIALNQQSWKRKWYEGKPKIDWSIKQKIKAGSNPVIAQKHFNETLSNYTNHHQVYTDGSLTNNTVGCGITNLDANESAKLNKRCNIFSAEALGLAIATDTFAPDDKPTVIFTDSASCLMALEQGDHEHPWIQQVNLACKDRNITYCWVPGHSGIRGNEAADKLANEGRSKETEHPFVPAHDAIEWVKKEAYTAHDLEWRSKSTSFLRKTKHTSFKWKDRKNIAEQKVLTRLRIGHTWLSHTYKLEKTDPPKCTFCNHDLTADHLIRDCVGYVEERAKYNTENLSIYNNDESNEQNLINFLRETKLLEKV